MSTVDKILAERPSKHGEFEENSRCTWAIVRALEAERNWTTLSDTQKHTLYMVSHKMARIVTGNPDIPEHWEDIEGYAKCITNRMEKPVIPYESDGVYETLARGWGVTREEAKKRFHALGYGQTAGSSAGRPGTVTPVRPVAPAGGLTGVQEPSLSRPGTPDDGGHHASAADMAKKLAPLSNLDEDIAKELKKEF